MTRDPFRLDGPTVISFSGGRTSGLMLRRILDAHDGALPSDARVVFTNTSKEREETLRFVRDCGERWGVNIHWIERDHTKPPRSRWREVDFASATRDGSLLSRLIVEKKFLPNQAMRFCTTELKVRTMAEFMATVTTERWTNVIGLRRDEPRRVLTIKARENAWDTACPLYDAGVTVADVHAYWSASPFDLALRPWEGNCDGCMLKGMAILSRIERDRPGTMTWWAAEEAKRGAQFSKERTYLQVIARASAPVLDGIFDEQPALPCACTD